MDLNPGGSAADVDDATLVQTWAGGDEQGYAALVTRYAPMVYSRCRRALGAVDAEDATQAVFLVLLRKRAQASASPALAAWLLTVAKLVVRNAVRDRQRRGHSEYSVSLSLPAAEGPDMDDLQEHLDACLADLPTTEREAVRLHHLAGHTLAEVAQHTGTSISTVHDRIKRGLERLRSLLAKRGVRDVSLVAVLGCFMAQASASEVPARLILHLRDLAPAATGVAATAVPSVQAQRWSNLGLSIMSHLVLVSLGLLAVGGSTWFAATLSAGDHPAATTPSPQPSLQPVVIAPLAVPTSGLSDLTHGHPGMDPTSGWIVVRVNDGARLAARLRQQPECTLIDSMEWINNLVSVRSCMIAVGVHVDPKESRNNGGNNKTDHPHVFSFLSQYNLIGRLECSDEQAWLLREIRARSTARVPADQSSADLLRKVVIRGATASVTQQSILPGFPRIEKFASLWQEPVNPEADVEIRGLLDPGISGQPAVQMVYGAMNVTESGLHLTWKQPWMNHSVGQTAQTSSFVDRQCFDQLPANALGALAVSLRPKEFQQSDVWKSVTVAADVGEEGHHGKFSVLFTGKNCVLALGVNQRLMTKLTAIANALDEVNGHLVAWAEPGVGLPVLTVEADLPQAAAERMMTELGLSRQADGTVLLPASLLNWTMGWNAGRLIITTNPGGIKAVRHDGGFTQQAEVKGALAAMPENPSSVCAVLNASSLMAQFAPFLALGAGDSKDTRLTDYQRQLAASKAHSYLTISQSASGHSLEANGILAIVSGMVLAHKVREILHPPHAAN